MISDSIVMRMVLVASILGAPSYAACVTPPLLIARADVWTIGGTLANHDVLVSGGRIIAIEPAGKIRRPPGAEVIEAHGNTLLPGLIDGHAHLFSTGGPWPVDFEKDARGNVFPITAGQTLRSGVTSARTHLFDRVEGPSLKKLSLDDCFPAPRLQIGGPGLTAGAPDMNGRQFTGYRNLDDAKQKLALMRQSGADWVALHSLDRFPPDELRAIAAEARRLGLRIIAAGDSLRAVEAALDIRADSVEYLARDAEGSYSRAQLERMKSQGIIAVPPIGYLHRHAAYIQDQALWTDPLLTLFMPADIAAFMMDRSRFRENLGRVRQDLSIPVARFEQLRAAGIAIAAGTDSGSPGNFQVDAIWWELETYRKLGAAPNEAVTAATSMGSKLLRDPDVGAIRVGARGDLVLYRGDVNSGSFDVKRVLVVAKGGQLFVKDGRWVGP